MCIGCFRGEEGEGEREGKGERGSERGGGEEGEGSRVMAGK